MKKGKVELFSCDQLDLLVNLTNKINVLRRVYDKLHTYPSPLDYCEDTSTNWNTDDTD